MILARIVVAFALAQSFVLGAQLHAGEAPEPTPYSGDIWSRSTLSGDWFGLRNELAAKGVTLDMSLTQAAQGIVHGGKEPAGSTAAGAVTSISCSTPENLACGPADFFTVEAEGNFIPSRYFAQIDQRQVRRAHAGQQQPVLSHPRR